MALEEEELLLKQLPHSVEAEQAVLAPCSLTPPAVKDVMDQLQPDDFYLRQNREIFETIYSMFTYAKPSRRHHGVRGDAEGGTYDENTTRSYLAQLMEITPTSAT